MDLKEVFKEICEKNNIHGYLDLDRCGMLFFDAIDLSQYHIYKDPCIPYLYRYTTVTNEIPDGYVLYEGHYHRNVWVSLYDDKKPIRWIGFPMHKEILRLMTYQYFGYDIQYEGDSFMIPYRLLDKVSMVFRYWKFQNEYWKFLKDPNGWYRYINKEENFDDALYKGYSFNLGLNIYYSGYFDNLTHISLFKPMIEDWPIIMSPYDLKEMVYKESNGRIDILINDKDRSFYIYEISGHWDKHIEDLIKGTIEICQEIDMQGYEMKTITQYITEVFSKSISPNMMNQNILDINNRLDNEYIRPYAPKTISGMSKDDDQKMLYYIIDIGDQQNKAIEMFKEVVKGGCWQICNSSGTLRHIYFIEPRFEYEIDNFDYKYLYHYTQGKNIKKIQERGLIPKDHTKGNIQYSDRLFLSACDTKEEALDDDILLGTLKEFHEDDPYKSDDWYVILIDAKRFLDTYRKDLKNDMYRPKIYKDPNMNERYFTYNTISPKYFEIIKL